MKKAILEYQTNKKRLLENIKNEIEDYSLKADEIISEIFEKSGFLTTNHDLISAAKVRFDLGNPPEKKIHMGTL